MNEPLVLHPSSTAQWKALVEDASANASIDLNEELQSYLVFLLMRFNTDPWVIHHILAQDFLENISKRQKQQQDNLRDVGDKCLLFSGLFPENAKRKHVEISYYVKMGQTAYNSLSQTNEAELAELFSQLCEEFVKLMDVLHSIRSLDPTAPSLDLLTAENLWRETHSQTAAQILQQKTNSFFLPPNHTRQ